MHGLHVALGLIRNKGYIVEMFSQTLAVLSLSLHVYGVVSPSSWHLLVFSLKYVVYRPLCLTYCTGGNYVYTCTCMVMYVHVLSS